MKPRLLAAIFTATVFLSSVAEASCADEEVRFSFANIQAKTAFSLLADFAGLELDIDESIDTTRAIDFDCMHWRKAASFLAAEFGVNLKIYNGFIYVDR